MVQLIEVGSDAYNQLIEEVIKTTVQLCRQELKQEEDFLTQEQTMKLLKIKSKQKMKQIRDSNVIKFKCLGGAYLFSKKSLLDWMNR